MNTETSPLDHHARLMAAQNARVEELNAEADRIHADRVRLADERRAALAARDNAVQQARIQAQEARTQRSIVMGILRELGLPEQDWNAERLVVEHVEQLEHELLALKGGGLPSGWHVVRSKSDKGELCWSAQRDGDAVEVWMYDDGEVEMDNVGAVVLVDELLAVLHHLRTLRAGA
jgi:hypothetical protein